MHCEKLVIQHKTCSVYVCAVIACLIFCLIQVNWSVPARKKKKKMHCHIRKTNLDRTWKRVVLANLTPAVPLMCALVTERLKIREIQQTTLLLSYAWSCCYLSVANTFSTHEAICSCLFRVLSWLRLMLGSMQQVLFAACLLNRASRAGKKERTLQTTSSNKNIWLHSRCGCLLVCPFRMIRPNHAVLQGLN